MDRIIEKLDRGWWIVSHEQKLWLPGENYHMAKRKFRSCGASALQIGEWQGDRVDDPPGSSAGDGIVAPGAGSGSWIVSTGRARGSAG
jgi:NADH pyrophosphatase NudC (nudix superfamily)